jgi:uncharacterized protein
MTDRAAENLRERLSRALPVAMKARDRLAVAALRSALAAIANAEAVGPSRAPPQAGHPEPPGSEGGLPAPPGPGGDPPFAGTVAGLGAAEVERRSLTGAHMEEIVRAEIADRETAAAEYERAGQLEHAGRLRGEAKVLASHLGAP